MADRSGSFAWTKFSHYLNKKLFYWFDFGDDWTFEIRKMGKDFEPVARAKYPRVIHEEGPKPEQYPDADW